MLLSVTLIKFIHQCLIVYFLLFSTKTWSKKLRKIHIRGTDFKLMFGKCFLIFVLLSED